MNKTKAKEIHLKDYAPPAFLIDTVALHVSLGEETTIVRSVLKMRRNPAVADSHPLVLDGEHLTLGGVMLDLRVLSPQDYVLSDESLTIADVPNEFQLDVLTQIKPQENTALEGLY